MSAELLRKAATILRERAEVAKPGPWLSVAEVPDECDGPFLWSRDRGSVVSEWAVGGRDAAYIATMHPDVGLALADWLDGIAAGWPWDGEEPGVVDWDGDRLLLANSLDSHALTLARLIVGENA